MELSTQAQGVFVLKTCSMMTLGMVSGLSVIGVSLLLLQFFQLWKVLQDDIERLLPWYENWVCHVAFWLLTTKLRRHGGLPFDLRLAMQQPWLPTLSGQASSCALHLYNHSDCSHCLMYSLLQAEVYSGALGALSYTSAPQACPGQNSRAYRPWAFRFE